MHHSFWLKILNCSYITFTSVSSVAQSCLTLYDPMTPAYLASLSITNSQSLLKLIESVMPSNHLILCHPLLLLPSIFPGIKVFSNESVLCIRCQSIGVSASASVLPMNSQDWFSLALTGLISLLSKGLSRVFSSTTVWKHQCPLHWKYSLNHWTISEVWRCINIAGCC